MPQGMDELGKGDRTVDRTMDCPRSKTPLRSIKTPFRSISGQLFVLPCPCSTNQPTLTTMLRTTNVVTCVVTWLLLLLLTTMGEAKPCADAANMARITDTLCMDRWELAIQLSNGSINPFFHPVDNQVGYKAISTQGKMRPQAYISLDQAKTACANAGKHLCTETEWYIHYHNTPHHTSTTSTHHPTP